MRSAGAYSFFMYSKQACARALSECIGGRMRLFYALDGPTANKSAGKDFVRTIISREDAEVRRGKKGTHEKVDCNGDYSSYGH